MSLTTTTRVLQSNLLSFSPPLPKNKTSAINQLGMANLNRIMLRFPAPFWSNDTYTLGFLPDSSPLYLDPDEDDEDLEEWLTEPLLSVAVNAAYEDRPVGPGAVLTFMVGGDSSPKLQARSEGKLVARVMQHIRAAFGANVPAPTHVHVSDWAHEPLARGSYSFVPVGTPLHAGAAALATPVAHTLFFAGEATLAGPARGTTHGAFLSGIREAARMLGRARVVERVWSADAASITIAEGRSVSSQANRGSMVVDDWFTVPRSKLVVQE
jgi:monoamine oxidase